MCCCCVDTDVVCHSPYITKFGKSALLSLDRPPQPLTLRPTGPTTALPLSLSALIPITYHKNPTTGSYYDPITYKPFNEHTHIVVNIKSGNVYSWESVGLLGVKKKDMKDLLTGEEFERGDLVTLQVSPLCS